MASGPVLRVGRLRYPISRSMTVIGRAFSSAPPGREGPDIDLSPMDRRKVVSRRHAHLLCDGKDVYIRDAGSTNGTLVAREILIRGSVVRLRDGDRISFGGVEARFEARGRWPAGLAPLWQAGPTQADVDPPADDTMTGPRVRSR